MDSKELASALLDELLARLQPAPEAGDGLGWCYPESNVTYVYGARADNGAPWYEGIKDEAGNFKQNPTDASIRGVIKSFYPYEVKSDKYGSSWKIRLTLNCGSAGIFNLQCGTQSVAGHNLIHALSNLTPDEVTQPITITPRASEQDAKVLFLEVSTESRRLESAWDKSEASAPGFWAEKMKSATRTIAGVMGEAAVTAPVREAQPQQPANAPTNAPATGDYGEDIPF